jgi:molybdate transport system ATP-binding protein
MPADAGARPSPTLHVRARVARDARGFALDVEFDAPPGVTILFGPSGSGKSTALAAIAGLVRPNAGRIALGDEAWFDAEARIERPVHRRHVAFVFQSLALFPHMTAAQNVAYGMAGGLDRPAKRDRARAMLDRLHVVHLADRKPPTFSGGEAQRVALARALATSPRAVLLDEPFSALDRELRRELVADVRTTLRGLGVPVIHVTHQRHEARALGDRLVVLDKGRVARVGPVDELFESERDKRDMTFDETPMDADEAMKR